MHRPTGFKETGSSFDEVALHPTAQYIARLMSPTQVAEATSQKSKEVREWTRGHWLLCGDVATPMFNLLKSVQRRTVAARLTGFTSSDGFSYCVLTHQVERSQHRFLLSLSDPAVRTLLESITTDGKLAFMLGNDDGADALLLDNPLTPRGFLPILAMAHPADLGTQRMGLRELADVQGLIGNPHQVPSIFQQYAVNHASVSLLLPTIVNDMFKDTMEKAVKL